MENAINCVETAYKEGGIKMAFIRAMILNIRDLNPDIEPKDITETLHRIQLSVESTRAILRGMAEEYWDKKRNEPLTGTIDVVDRIEARYTITSDKDIEIRVSDSQTEISGMESIFRLEDGRLKILEDIKMLGDPSTVYEDDEMPLLKSLELISANPELAKKAIDEITKVSYGFVMRYTIFLYPATKISERLATLIEKETTANMKAVKNIPEEVQDPLKELRKDLSVLTLPHSDFSVTESLVESVLRLRGLNDVITTDRSLLARYLQQDELTLTEIETLYDQLEGDRQRLQKERSDLTHQLNGLRAVNIIIDEWMDQLDEANDVESEIVEREKNPSVEIEDGTIYSDSNRVLTEWELKKGADFILTVAVAIHTFLIGDTNPNGHLIGSYNESSSAPWYRQTNQKKKFDTINYNIHIEYTREAIRIEMDGISVEDSEKVVNHSFEWDKSKGDFSIGKISPMKETTREALNAIGVILTSVLSNLSNKRK